MKVVSFVNRKGGVGKSSCVLHVGLSLAKRGIRTLLVDIDPQSSLSQGLLGRESLELPSSSTLAGIYDNAGTPFSGLVLDVGRPNLGLVAGHERMSDHNVPMPWTTGEDQFILRDGLAEIANEWDLCLVDCPPHVQFCAWSALVAADGVVIPAQMEDFGIMGIAAIMDSIDFARDRTNPKLRLLGVLPTMVVKALSIHANYDANLRTAYGDDAFLSIVPAAKDYKEAVTLRKAVCEYKPKSAASKAIETVADELLTRIAERCGVAAIDEPGQGRGAA